MKIKNKITLLLYIFVFSLIVSFMLIRYFGNRYGNYFMSYGEGEVRRIVTLIINNSISLVNYQDSFDGDILHVNVVNNNIQSIDLDSYKSNLFLDNINKDVFSNLRYISSGNINKLSENIKQLSDMDFNNFKEGFIYYVPMGSIFGNGLISNLGPLIPVKLSMIGDVISNLNSNVVEYGINNAIIEVSVDVDVSLVINMLFVSKKINVNVSRIIFMKAIQGKIPNYLLGTNNVSN